MKYFYWFLVFCLLATFFGSAAQLEAEPDENFTPTFRPALAVKMAEGDISINGQLNDPGWQGAAVATDFAEHYPGDQTKPPLLINGYFYAQFGTNRRRDGLMCMSMDGEIMWKTKRDPDFNKGSMILADGLILATDGAKSLYLIEPDPSGFKLLASAELLESKAGDERMAARFATQNWAPLALAYGKLLIRDQTRMMCVKVAE